MKLLALFYIEALASGKPIIGTFNGGAEDIINNDNGLLVQVDNIEELENAMKYIKENLSKYDSQEIRKSCENRFSKKVIVKEIIKVYEEILKTL